MQIINYYKKIKIPEEEANAWYDLGDLLPANNKINIAKKIVFFQRADSVYKKLNLKKEQTDALKAIGDAHLNEGKFDLAETELLQVIDQYKKEGYKKLAYTFDLLGEVARQKGDLQKKLYYELEVVKNLEGTPDTATADYFYHKLATTYNDLKKFKESVYWSNKALNMAYNHPDHGLLYLYSALYVSDLIALNKEKDALAFFNNIVKKKPPTDEGQKISAYQSYGKIYDALKYYGSAKQSYTNMISVIEKQSADRGIVNQYITIHNHIIDYLTNIKFFVSIRDYNNADYYLKRVQLFSDSLESPASKRDINYYGFLLDSIKGNYISAIKHYQQYKQINDSIFNTTKSKQIAEIDIKYQTEQKISSIKLLKNQQESQQAELRKVRLQKNITFGGITAFMIIAGLAYNGYRNKLKSNKLLYSKQTEINQQNHSLQQLIGDKDKLLSEKDWLLKEVHHRVKNNLQIVMSLLNTQSAFLENKEALNALNQSKDRVHAISLIHQKLYAGKNISMINLPSYVAELIYYLKDSFNVYDRKVTINSFIEEIDIDIAQAVPLGLILNEAITNAIKYAFDSKGGKVDVELKMVDDHMAMLSVADNGRGFPEAFDRETNNTLGMQMIMALSKQLKGTLKTENNNGAEVIVKFRLETFPIIAETPHDLKKTAIALN
jgi:two-component sensor histidine kinase